MNRRADRIHGSIERLCAARAVALPEHPRWREIHGRSKAFLAESGLLVDERTLHYLDRACVAWGCALCFPRVSDEVLQLIVDWTNHNCLHDDHVEGLRDPYAIAELGQRYTAVLSGAPLVDGDPPLIRAIAAWGRRAAALTPAGWLRSFAARADRMCRSFVLERLLLEVPLPVRVREYASMRAAAGPFDAWFDFVLLALPAGAAPADLRAETSRLRDLAVHLAVLGNEIRTQAREAAQRSAFNLLDRTGAAEDEALGEVARIHEETCREFEARRGSARDPWLRAYADTLALALLATDHYERESCRGLRWEAGGAAWS